MACDWERAVDAQRGLQRWWASTKGREWGREFFEQDPNCLPDSAKARTLGQDRTLLTAPTYFVTQEMTAVIQVAGASMPPERLRILSDLPSRDGFVYFDRFITTDLPPVSGPITFQALSWSVQDNYVDIAIYEDVGRVRSRSTFRETAFSVGIEDPDGWLANFYHLMPVTSYRSYDGAELEYGESEYGRFAKALWTISQQKLASIRPVKADRATARRLGRADFPLDKVRVITLRRTASPEAHPPEGVSHVEWSHRWLVSGHWRNQYLPSVDAHRLQWISEYIKGPEDRPLLIRPDVFRVAR